MKIRSQYPFQTHQLRLIDLKRVVEITSLSRTTIYQLIRDGKFPKQRIVSKRSARWVEAEVHAWVRQHAQLNKPQRVIVNSRRRNFK